MNYDVARQRSVGYWINANTPLDKKSEHERLMSG